MAMRQHIHRAIIRAVSSRAASATLMHQRLTRATHTIPSSSAGSASTCAQQGAPPSSEPPTSHNAASGDDGAGLLDATLLSKAGVNRHATLRGLEFATERLRVRLVRRLVRRLAARGAVFAPLLGAAVSAHAAYEEAEAALHEWRHSRAAAEAARGRAPSDHAHPVSHAATTPTLAPTSDGLWMAFATAAGLDTVIAVAQLATVVELLGGSVAAGAQWADRASLVAHAVPHEATLWLAAVSATLAVGAEIGVERRRMGLQGGAGSGSVEQGHVDQRRT